MYRNYYRDDPAMDAEDDRHETRPLLGYCQYCGCEIYGETDTLYADEAYKFGSVDGDFFVCEDCLRDYEKEHRLRGC